MASSNDSVVVFEHQLADKNLHSGLSVLQHLHINSKILIGKTFYELDGTNCHNVENLMTYCVHVGRFMKTRATVLNRNAYKHGIDAMQRLQNPGKYCPRFNYDTTKRAANYLHWPTLSFWNPLKRSITIIFVKLLTRYMELQAATPFLTSPSGHCTRSLTITWSYFVLLLRMAYSLTDRI